MGGVMLAIIIFVLGLLKFSVTLNPSTHFPSYTNFIFATASYCSSSSCCCCSLTAAGPCCCSSSSLAVAGSYCCSSSSTSFSTMSFKFSCPYPIFSFILLYNKEAVLRTLCSLSANTSCVSATGADTALHNFETVFLKMCSSFIIRF